MGPQNSGRCKQVVPNREEVVNSGLTVYIETKEVIFRCSSVTACIRRQEGFCCIQYQVCSDVANAFALEATSTPAALVDSKCTLDYVAIPGIYLYIYLVKAP